MNKSKLDFEKKMAEDIMRYLPADSRHYWMPKNVTEQYVRTKNSHPKSDNLPTTKYQPYNVV